MNSSSDLLQMDLAHLGEFGLINHVRHLCDGTLSGNMLGIGDDCAVIPITEILRRTSDSKYAVIDPGSSFDQQNESNRSGYLLLTADSLVDGVHFTSRTSTAYSLGAKSLAVNLSDIAAMGGVPISASICLHIPVITPVEYLEEFYRGLTEQARSSNCAVSGGDTVRSSEFAISISVVGFCDTYPILRCGAKDGDDLWVSGAIGCSGAGLQFLLSSQQGDERCILAHQQPVPRLSLGRKLIGLASACIDISDGLIQDVGHLCRINSLSAVIEENAVPVPEAVRKVIGLKKALVAGEDYELAFTASPNVRQQIECLGQALALGDLCRIGEMQCRSDETEVLIKQENGLLIAASTWLEGHALGFSHF